MKKVAFIGGFDKTDLILYVSRIITVLEKKVLFVDTTITQKAKYLVPTITPARKYVTCYDGFDVAIGFESMTDLREYLSVENFDYDYMIADIDSPEAYRAFQFSNADIHLLATTFDVYSIQKALDVIRYFQGPTPIMKLIFTRDPESEESDYIDFVTLSSNAKWKSDIVYFPFEAADFYAIFENQRFSKVRFFNLSFDYMEALVDTVEEITKFSKGDIRKAIKLIEKQ